VDGGGVWAAGAGVTSPGFRRVVEVEPGVVRRVRIPLRLWPVADRGFVVVPFVPDLFVPDRLVPLFVPVEFVRPLLDVLFGVGEVVVGAVGSVGLPGVPAGGVTGAVES